MINYRKAEKNDIFSITKLVSDLLGTSYYDNTRKDIATYEEIFENNKKVIEEQINNFYVAYTNNKIIGTCGYSDNIKSLPYNIDIKKPYRRLTYIAVHPQYQNQGIGYNLTKLCCNTPYPILCEAWGDNGKYVNTKFILEKLGFIMVKDLQNYYKQNNNCPFCVNRNKNCTSCMCQIWIKYN